MWELAWQDFRRHAFGDPVPPVQRETFADQATANKRKAELQAVGLIACVTPLKIRRRRIKQRLDGEGPIFNSEWKLAE